MLGAVLLLAAALAHSAPKTVLVLGDSLSAEYGLSRGSGWVALLEQKLKAEKIDAAVVNASISGETTSGGRVRLPALLAQYKPTLVIIELGANDGLRGLPVAAMKQNLGAIIEQSQKAGAKVLLVGMHLPPNYGPAYTKAFERAFADLAKSHHTALLPFLLEGFGEKSEFFQPDRIHPTERAQPAVLANVWRALAPLLKKK